MRWQGLTLWCSVLFLFIIIARWRNSTRLHHFLMNRWKRKWININTVCKDEHRVPTYLKHLVANSTYRIILGDGKITQHIIVSNIRCISISMLVDIPLELRHIRVTGSNIFWLDIFPALWPSDNQSEFMINGHQQFSSYLIEIISISRHCDEINQIVKDDDDDVGEKSTVQETSCLRFYWFPPSFTIELPPKITFRQIFDRLWLLLFHFP